tara:strand:+ start:218 stop:595 length:378 start_codon:yes stop_codon:yes gene_type:complete
MDFSDVNTLGNIINTTFGKSSSPDGTYSIKCDLAGDTLTLKYSTIVHFAGEHALGAQVSRCADEATQRLDEYLADIKKVFKEASGKTLKHEKGDGSDNVELISATSNSLRKIAYYRMNWALPLGQ